MGKKFGWFYGIVYDKKEKAFITAEIYESKNGKLSFCQAPIVEESFKNLQATLLELFIKGVSLKYYIWNGKELKHASQ